VAQGLDRAQPTGAHELRSFGSSCTFTSCSPFPAVFRPTTIRCTAQRAETHQDSIKPTWYLVQLTTEIKMKAQSDSRPAPLPLQQDDHGGLHDDASPPPYEMVAAFGSLPQPGYTSATCKFNWKLRQQTPYANHSQRTVVSISTLTRDSQEP
jgi:hypothetical protein